MSAFSSIDTTNDIGGLAFGLSWTHMSSIWMHLNTSLMEQLSKTDVSTKSLCFPSFHKFHA
uniref:Uncharacterized protein n=1 Tax=Oryza brachyantha TaxID=4533 RepID=J3M1Q8_ORYBR